MRIAVCGDETSSSSSSSSVGATARCGLWPVEQYLPIFPYLSPTPSIFSLPALEDVFPLLLSILSWVFLFVLSFPVLQWRSFRASYPPFSPGDPANLSIAPLSILLYFLLYSTPLVLLSRYSSTFFDHLTVLSELTTNWGTDLSYLHLSCIYFTGQQHNVSFFPGLCFCRSCVQYCCITDHA